MATFATSANQVGGDAMTVGSASHTLPYTTLSPTQSVTGLSPENAGVSDGGDLGSNTRSGVAAAAGRYVAESDLSFSYTPLTPTQSVSGMRPGSAAFSDDNDIGHRGYDGADDARAYRYAPADDHTLAGATETYTGQGFDPEASVVGTEENMESMYVGTGGVIPASYFRRVSGNVLDEEGEPIEGALYVAALGGLPTLGYVNPDTGRYNIYLLRQNYTDLILLQRAPNGKPFDFVRYELAETPDLDIHTIEADLYFDTTLPKPVNIGHGVDFGGQMTL